jgi:hypothetical protein
LKDADVRGLVKDAINEAGVRMTALQQKITGTPNPQ